MSLESDIVNLEQDFSELRYTPDEILRLPSTGTKEDNDALLAVIKKLCVPGTPEPEVIYVIAHIAVEEARMAGDRFDEIFPDGDSRDERNLFIKEFHKRMEMGLRATSEEFAKKVMVGTGVDVSKLIDAGYGSILQNVLKAHIINQDRQTSSKATPESRLRYANHAETIAELKSRKKHQTPISRPLTKLQEAAIVSWDNETERKRIEWEKNGKGLEEHFSNENAVSYGVLTMRIMLNILRLNPKFTSRQLAFTYHAVCKYIHHRCHESATRLRMYLIDAPEWSVNGIDVKQFWTDLFASEQCALETDTGRYTCNLLITCPRLRRLSFLATGFESVVGILAEWSPRTEPFLSALHAAEISLFFGNDGKDVPTRGMKSYSILWMLILGRQNLWVPLTDDQSNDPSIILNFLLNQRTEFVRNRPGCRVYRFGDGLADEVDIDRSIADVSSSPFWTTDDESRDSGGEGDSGGYGGGEGDSGGYGGQDSRGTGKPESDDEGTGDEPAGHDGKQSSDVDDSDIGASLPAELSSHSGFESADGGDTPSAARPSNQTELTGVPAAGPAKPLTVKEQWQSQQNHNAKEDEIHPEDSTDTQPGNTGAKQTGPKKALTIKEKWERNQKQPPTKEVDNLAPEDNDSPAQIITALQGHVLRAASMAKDISAAKPAPDKMSMEDRWTGQHPSVIEPTPVAKEMNDIWEKFHVLRVNSQEWNEPSNAKRTFRTRRQLTYSGEQRFEGTLEDAQKEYKQLLDDCVAIETVIMETKSQEETHKIRKASLDPKDWRKLHKRMSEIAEYAEHCVEKDEAVEAESVQKWVSDWTLLLHRRKEKMDTLHMYNREKRFWLLGWMCEAWNPFSYHSGALPHM